MENFGRELVEGTHANRMGRFPEIEENLKGNKQLIPVLAFVKKKLDSPASKCGLHVETRQFQWKKTKSNNAGQKNM